MIICITGGSEDGKKTKSVRALETRDDGDDSDGLNQRDRLEDEDEETGKAPPGFLSPSVREYLELGRSIPGIFGFTGVNFLENQVNCNVNAQQPSGKGGYQSLLRDMSRQYIIQVYTGYLVYSRVMNIYIYTCYATTK